MAEKQTNKDRMREIVDSIENGIKELFESDKYQQYLSTMSRFHRYSVNNTMLIYMQRPDATHVAGFNKWRDQFGRNVLKGEKGIRIIAPTPYKKKVEEIKTDPETNAPVLDADGKAIIEEKEIRIPMFKVVSVFDVSQTAGKPLPQLAADLSGNVQQYEVFMEALRRASPVPMEIKPVARDTDGFFSIKAQSITIRAGMSEVQTVCAAVHEIAHAKLHDYEHMTELADDGETILVPGEKSRNTEEVEAESISYLHDVHEAEELMLDVFAYLFTKKPRIRDGGFKAYLYKAARHMALRHRSKRKPLFSLDALTGEPDGRLLAEEVIRTEERNRILHFCMDEMNPDYREVLYLTYFEDMSYAQAAEVTGKTVKQITNMVYRGKESLRRLLEREGITNAES